VPETLDQQDQERAFVFHNGLGEPLVLAVVHFKLLAPELVKARLLSAGIWQEDAGRSFLVLDVGGHYEMHAAIALDLQHLNVSCNSVEAAARARAEVEAWLAPDVARYQTTLLSNVDFLAIEALEQLELPEHILVDDDLLRVVGEVMRAFLDDWWAVPNPGLGGETPRDALTAGPSSRARVLRFLRALDSRLDVGPIPVPYGRSKSNG
jgi:hypothetical protein